MPAKKTKTRVPKSKINKKATASKWLLLAGVLIFVAIGLFFVYKSFASALPTLVRGQIYSNSTYPVYSPRLTTTSRARLCVESQLSPQFRDTAQYRWFVDVKNRNGSWSQVKRSAIYSARGEKIRVCYQNGIVARGIYRVRFDRPSSDISRFPITGNYTVIGDDILRSDSSQQSTETVITTIDNSPVQEIISEDGYQ